MGQVREVNLKVLGPFGIIRLNVHNSNVHWDSDRGLPLPHCGRKKVIADLHFDRSTTTTHRYDKMTLRCVLQFCGLQPSLNSSSPIAYSVRPKASADMHKPHDELSIKPDQVFYMSTGF